MSLRVIYVCWVIGTWNIREREVLPPFSCFVRNRGAIEGVHDALQHARSVSDEDQAPLSSSSACSQARTSRCLAPTRFGII